MQSQDHLLSRYTILILGLSECLSETEFIPSFKHEASVGQILTLVLHLVVALVEFSNRA